MVAMIPSEAPPMTDAPALSLVIPHHRGSGPLLACLDALRVAAPADADWILVDDGSRDDSVARARAAHPHLRVVTQPRRTGFAAAANAGARAARGSLLLFLNDDTVPQPGFSEALRARLRAEPRAVAVQPKLLQARDPGRFDHAGAAGGGLDLLGYPFARGRVFDEIERDHGQYDAALPVFWASGAALLVERAAFESAGGFDESFFAHMEEIDLCWRLQLAGGEVWCEPAAVVHHVGGATLGPGSFRKHFLNHRNSLLMLCSNTPALRLAGLLPLRLLLEAVASLERLARGDLTHALAIPAALLAAAARAPGLPARRRRTRALRRAGAAELPFLRRSLVLERYLRGRRTWSEIVGGATG